MKVTFTCSTWTPLWPYPNPRSAGGGTGRKSPSGKIWTPESARPWLKWGFNARDVWWRWCAAGSHAWALCRRSRHWMASNWYMLLLWCGLHRHTEGLNLCQDTLFRSFYYVHTSYIYILYTFIAFWNDYLPWFVWILFCMKLWLTVFAGYIDRSWTYRFCKAIGFIFKWWVARQVEKLCPTCLI